MKDRRLEELRENMVTTIESLSVEMGVDGSSEEIRKDAEDEVGEFEATVREDECERIRKASRDLNRAYEIEGACVLIPASVLASKEKP
jgi:hypothetical protein